MLKTIVAVTAALTLSFLVTGPSHAQQPAQVGQGQGKGQGKGKGGGGKGRAAAPALPPPRTPEGKVILDGEVAGKNGVWTPGIGINEPAAPLANVPFQPWAKALYDERQKNELEPHTRCKASGVARQFMTPYGVEFVDIPELSRVFIFDIGGPHTFRTIYMDGRSHPANFAPTNYGHSIGWWEGDTLVVDSVGFNEDFWLDRRGLPHTDQLHTVERFTRTNKNTIDYKLTIDDPGAYTAPFDGGFNLRYNENQELFEYVCQQANYASELMVGGETRVIDRSSPIVP
ncbi:MAG TPA: hypothetical protein VGN17_15970 [Bryobacteraceae bacterium]|jgi:hypothetical protein